MSLGVSRRTVCSILEKFESGETLRSKSGSGRKPLKLRSPKQARTGWWHRLATYRVGASWCSLARKFNISKSFVHHVLKKAGVKHYKRQKAPDTTPAQEQSQRTQLRKMRWSRSCRAWIKPSKCPPSSPNWARWGSPEGSGLQGWLTSRYRGSAEVPDHSMPAGHGLGACPKLHRPLEDGYSKSGRQISSDFSLTRHKATW